MFAVKDGVDPRFSTACRNASLGPRTAIKSFNTRPIKEREGEPLEKYLLVVTGGSGTGKSTLIEVLKRKKVLKGNEFFITPHLFQDCMDLSEQDLKHRHPEKASLTDSDSGHSPRNEQYAKMMMDFVNHAMRETYQYSNSTGEKLTGKGYPIVIDDHGDNLELMKKIFDQARKNNYKIVMAGLTCEDHFYFPQFREGCIARKCGSEAEIAANLEWALTLNKKFKSNWEELAGLADAAIIFLREKRNLISTTAVFSPHNVIILNEDNYAQFQNWRQLNTKATGYDDLYLAGPIKKFKHFVARVGGGSEENGKGRIEEVGKNSGEKQFVERIKSGSLELSNRLS